MKLRFLAAVAALALAVPAAAHEGHHAGNAERYDAPAPTATDASAKRKWLAGDHHIHSEFSADYQPNPVDPGALPTPLFGKDGRYSIRKNAEMARQFSLAWMVSTDHGGPGHARINHDIAYPALLESRSAVPEVIQFFGMEFDTPAGDHSSLIIPRSPAERGQLREIEAGWSQREAHPADPARDKPERMIEGLTVMRRQQHPPVLIANHPSRSAPSDTEYGRYDPAEFRDWNDVAPNVAVGMEGAPGHQASALKPDGTLDPSGKRGSYRKVATMGGFDPMTARLGGMWDAFLGEGRRWWVTATSDSHVNWRDGGNDFWPGEYAKTYVLARRDPGDIVDGLRHGRIFVATGELVDSVDLRVGPAGGRGPVATTGGTLKVKPGQKVTVEVSVRDPAGHNAAGRSPEVSRVDLIAGSIRRPGLDRMADRNPTTRVVRRFTSRDWARRGDVLTMRHTFSNVREAFYVRLRGTSGGELEPVSDPAGEDPWNDLWFYSNPVFVELK